MIKIKIEKENLDFKTIKISGHANYDDYGKDIVCAGVSAILTTTVNAILSFDSKAITITDDKDIVLKVLKKDEITKKLILNMISLFYELEETYPKNITIREDGKNE